MWTIWNVISSKYSRRKDWLHRTHLIRRTNQICRHENVCAHAINSMPLMVSMAVVALHRHPNRPNRTMIPIRWSQCHHLNNQLMRTAIVQMKHLPANTFNNNIVQVLSCVHWPMARALWMHRPNWIYCAALNIKWVAKCPNEILKKLYRIANRQLMTPLVNHRRSVIVQCPTEYHRLSLVAKVKIVCCCRRWNRYKRNRFQSSNHRPHQTICQQLHQNFRKAFTLLPIPLSCYQTVSSYWIRQINQLSQHRRWCVQIRYQFKRQPPHRQNVDASMNAHIQIVVKIILNRVIWRPINAFTPANVHSFANGRIVNVVSHAPMSCHVTNVRIRAKKNLYAISVRNRLCEAIIYPNTSNVMQRKQRLAHFDPLYQPKNYKRSKSFCNRPKFRNRIERTKFECVGKKTTTTTTTTTRRRWWSKRKGKHSGDQFVWTRLTTDSN